MDKELWEQISRQLESSLPFKKKTWFKKVVFLGCDGDVINLGLHSEFTLQGLIRNGTDEILNTCSEFAGRPMQLNFTVIDDDEETAVWHYIPKLHRLKMPKMHIILKTKLCQCMAKLPMELAI